MLALRRHWSEALRRPLAIGIGVSLLVHTALLAMRFTPPEPLRFASQDSRLEVVLLNAKTARRPDKADVLAQVAMEAGGQHESGRATSPLKAETEAVDGTGLVAQRRRAQALEQEQRRLALKALDGKRLPEPDPKTNGTPVAQPGTGVTDVDVAIARLQAQIDRQISDYNKRPKRLTFGVNAHGVSYARYVADWASRVERIGTERYPPEARGKLYGSLLITVEIDKHGNVLDVVLNQKSPHEVLNRAVRAIVYAGAPYERFSPDMAREGDILQIVRTWTFTRDALATESAKAP